LRGPGKKRWNVQPRSPELPGLVRETGLSPLQVQLLINRGVRDPEAMDLFLRPRLSRLADPFRLKGMHEALSLIMTIIRKRGKTTVFGDYDADGLTSTALLVAFFRELGLPVSYYVPHRLEEGYGLNVSAIEKIAGDGTRLLITVDCGISNEREIRFAKERGLHVVVTDHHHLPASFQAICPVINPLQPGCGFAFKNLSGVGLAFFLAVALRSTLRKEGWFRERPEPDLKAYLDLVALGTVADRVPLVDQNRILVSRGVSVMECSRWPGMEAIKAVSDLSGVPLRAEDLAFRLAPQINAPGRMGDPEEGIKMLMAEDPQTASALALAVNSINHRRRGVEKQILAQIEASLQHKGGIGDRCILVLSGENWHPGVLGIVASRLVDRYCRPALVLNVDNGVAVGSGRSIEGFHLYRAMSHLGTLFKKFGGHARAAGFTLKAGNIRLLEAELERLARESLGGRDLLPVMHVDAEVRLDHLTPDLVGRLEALGPFGEANPEPVLLSRSLKVLHAEIVGERHLKLMVSRGGQTFEGIGFNLSHKKSLAAHKINAIFKPEMNCWKGYEKLQLKILDLESAV